MNHRHAAIIIVLAAATAAAATPQRRQTTTRRGRLVPVEDVRQADSARAAIAPDTLRGAEAGAAVLVHGYQKPLRSRKETFLITNRSDHSVSLVVLLITYTDTRGRMLHRRRIRVSADIPAGETRQWVASSWDPQFTRYYTANPPGKRAKGPAEPYVVDIAVESVVPVPNQ